MNPECNTNMPQGEIVAPKIFGESTIFWVGFRPLLLQTQSKAMAVELTPPRGDLLLMLRGHGITAF